MNPDPREIAENLASYISIPACSWRSFNRRNRPRDGGWNNCTAIRRPQPYWTAGAGRWMVRPECWACPREKIFAFKLRTLSAWLSHGPSVAGGLATRLVARHSGPLPASAPERRSGFLEVFQYGRGVFLQGSRLQRRFFVCFAVDSPRVSERRARDQPILTSRDRLRNLGLAYFLGTVSRSFVRTQARKLTL